MQKSYIPLLLSDSEKSLYESESVKKHILVIIARYSFAKYMRYNMGWIFGHIFGFEHGLVQ